MTSSKLAGILFLAAICCSVPTTAPFSDVVVAEEQPEPPSRKQLLKAAIADALARLEKRDYYGFIEYYFPIEVLLEIRKEERYAHAIADMIRDREKTKALISTLKKMQAADPIFEKDETIARFTIQEDPEKIPLLTIKPDKKSEPEIASYEGDLKTVIKRAIADLESGDPENIDRMLRSLMPVSELKFQGKAGRLLQNGTLISETLQKGESKEVLVRPAFSPGKMLADAMLADLKAVSELEPLITETKESALATFTIKGKAITQKTNRFGAVKTKTIQLPDRKIVFEQTAQGWRFQDQSTAEIQEWEKIQKMQPGGSFSSKFVWERFGNSWRISEKRE